VVIGKLTTHAQFADMARETIAMAGELFGDGRVQRVIADAWDAVGVVPAPLNEVKRPSARPSREKRPDKKWRDRPSPSTLTGDARSARKELKS
jgi:hypothetical protein